MRKRKKGDGKRGNEWERTTDTKRLNKSKSVTE